MGDNSNCFMRTLCITQFFVLIGHFYFGKNRTFLNWLDIVKKIIDIQKRFSYTPPPSNQVLIKTPFLLAIPTLKLTFAEQMMQRCKEDISIKQQITVNLNDKNSEE
jgi:hypothetical protein